MRRDDAARGSLWRWLPLILALMWLSSSAMAQSGGPQDIHERLVVAVATVAPKDGLQVDPRVVDEMTASAVLFAANWCAGDFSLSGGTKQACGRTFGAPQTLNEIVREYLRDAASGHLQITALGERMAAVVGDTLAMAGWPPKAPNHFGILDLGAGAHPVQLQFATGPVPALGSGSLLLVQSGTSTILTSVNGRSVARTATVAAAARARLAGEAAGANAMMGDIGASADLFCFNRGPSQFSGATQTFNWGRGRFGESDSVRESNRAQIARIAALDIRVIDNAGVCLASCQRALGANFAQAVAAWRGGCERCNADALVVISVGGAVWLDQRAASRLRSLASGIAVPLSLRQLVPGEMDATIAAPNLTNPTMTLHAYADVTDDAAVRRGLCTQSASVAAWVGEAQSFLCPGAGAATSVLQPTLTLTLGDTHCGSAEDFLACGLPNAGIEVTLSNASYRILTPAGVVVIGASTTGQRFEMRYVIFHEVGHWFGVPHAQVEGPHATMDIMGDTYGQGQPCISAASLMMLNNATDLRWPYRVTQGAGLRRPPRIRGR